MRLAVLCKESKTYSTLIYQQPCLLNAQEGQRGQVSVLIPALDRVKQAFAQEAPDWQWRAGDFGGGQCEPDIIKSQSQSETGFVPSSPGQ
jgi:hypothetical protein